jgi:hypothetical protein
MGTADMPKTIKETLDALSTMPNQIRELKRSCARTATMFALIRAKEYNEDLEVSELAGGFPQHNVEGNFFTKDDYNRLRRETRPVATKLAHEVNLDRYQVGYDDAGKRIKPGSFKTVSLIPHGRKDYFAPAVEPSNLIEEGDSFEELSSID